MLIRPYEPSDMPQLLALFKDTVRRVNIRDYTPEQIRAWASDEIDPVLWGQRFTGRFAIVAVDESDGRPLGFTELEPDGHIDRFFVSADHQGQGVGTALMNSIISEARRMGLTELHLEGSITARPAFEAWGFETLAQQTITCRDASMTNFRMRRRL